MSKQSEQTTITLEHNGKSVTTTADTMRKAADALRGEPTPAQGARKIWQEYEDAPECLQRLAREVREEYHPSLDRAIIKVVMHPDWQRADGAEAAMKVKLPDAVSRLRDGVDAYIIVSAPWFDRTDPRQTNAEEAEDGVVDAGDVNARLCRMRFDECFCQMNWTGAKIKRVKPLKVYLPIVRRWGVMPHTRQATLAEALRARDEQGVDFLEPVEGGDYAVPEDSDE